MSLLHQLDDGKKREILEEQYGYFLDVLPPVAFRFNFNGERWHFGFAEGHDYVYAFKTQDGGFFAQKTNLLNPFECGKSIEEQQADPSFVARYEASMREIRRAWGRTT